MLLYGRRDLECKNEWRCRYQKEIVMNISIFGLGYVGCVSLGCLAQDGHSVVGVDISKEKVDLINHGKTTIIESKIDKIIAEQFKQQRIQATNDYKKAVLETDVSIVCVGTPSTNEGHLDLESILKVARQIGEALKYNHGFHTIVIRSTVMPGTNHKVCEIIEEESGKKRSVDFGVVSNPEFMREGSAVEDYYNPAVIVIGSESKKAIDIVKQIYGNIDVPIIETDIMVAEVIKYVNNSFHALKIAFANEVGNICKKAGIDSHRVFDIFCQDSKLNISSKYFKPGFAYGGSCLPKDLKALKTLAHDYYLKSPVIDSINQSNDIQKDIAFSMVVSTGKKKIGIIGLSFKPGTDDLRYSPAVDLVERLLGKGYQIQIYDKNVFVSELTGTNKAYIEQHIPHLVDLITNDLECVLNESDVLVIAHNYEEISNFMDILSNKVVVDLVRIARSIPLQNYQGICW
jgi:GDP-mannose 6-dehydrogenase